MESTDIVASEMTQAKHAYSASGYTNGKIIWVILVNVIAGVVIAVLAPILYLLIMGLVIGFGISFCNVCGLLIIILPLALAIPWLFGAGIGYVANIINIGMQNATHNNSKTLRWFFMVFVVIGILVVFGVMAFADTPLKDMDMEDWIPIALIIYGAIGTTVGMIVIGDEEPLPPFCKPCLEYMGKIEVPAFTIENVHMVKDMLDQREFLTVIRNEIAYAPEAEEGENEQKLVAAAPVLNPMKKELKIKFYYCKSCMTTGVFEATYETEVTKMDGKKEKKENASQRIFSEMLTEEEVRSLFPVVEQVAMRK